LIPSYLRDSDIAIIVYDITSSHDITSIYPFLGIKSFEDIDT